MKKLFLFFVLSLFMVSLFSQAKKKVDIDLTKVNDNIIYAQLFNMMVEPDDYMGKTVRLRGTFNAFPSQDEQKYYFCVLVSDATACCQSGLEFIWNGQHNYPNDYPQPYSLIEIEGKFGSYKEGEDTYYCLFIDELIK